MAYQTGNEGLSFAEMMRMYESFNAKQQGGNQTQSTNTAGQGEMQAAGIIKPVTGMLGAIPIAGPIISGVGSLVSMGLQMSAADKQKSQAQSDLAAAKNMKPLPLPKEMLDKARADQFAAGSDAPGLQQANDALANDFATHLRAIQNNSRNGGQAAHAIATALGFNNESLSKLYANNMAYKAAAAKTARQDLWDIGLKKQGAQQTLFDNYQKPLFQQATALQNASTANRVGAGSGIANALSTIATSALKMSSFDQMIESYTNPNSMTGAGKTDTATPVELTGTDMQYNPVWDTTLGGGNQSYMTAPDQYNIPAADQSLNTPANNASIW